MVATQSRRLTALDHRKALMPAPAVSSRPPSEATTSGVPLGAHARPVTCASASHDASDAPVTEFHSRTRLSAAPPPEAKTSCRVGHHASALTAARCARVIETYGDARRASQRSTALSLPPDASRRPSSRHRTPHTASSCPRRQVVATSGVRRS